MEVVQTVINALVVAIVGLLLARITQNLRRDVKAEIAELRAEIHGIRTELKGEIAELRAETREMRSDLTLVALAVGAEPRAGRQ